MVRWVTAAVLCLLVLALAGYILLNRHYRDTPTFDEYLASHPVAPDLFEPLAGVARLGGPEGWQVGAVDPFSVVYDDAELALDEFVFELVIERGDVVLLRLVQLVARVTERESGTPVGMGVRTSELSVREGLRASAKVYIPQARDVLAPGRYAVAFDVLLGAGTGPSRTAVFDLPSGHLDDAGILVGTKVRPSVPSDVLAGLRRLSPWAELPAEGLIHRVYASGKSSGGTGRSLTPPTVGEIFHEVNTDEYAYRIKARTTAQGPNGSSSQGSGDENKRTWRGDVW